MTNVFTSTESPDFLTKYALRYAETVSESPGEETRGYVNSPYVAVSERDSKNAGFSNFGALYYLVDACYHAVTYMGPKVGDDSLGVEQRKERRMFTVDAHLQRPDIAMERAKSPVDSFRDDVVDKTLALGAVCLLTFYSKTAPRDQVIDSIKQSVLTNTPIEYDNPLANEARASGGLVDDLDGSIPFAMATLWHHLYQLKPQLKLESEQPELQDAFFSLCKYVLLDMPYLSLVRVRRSDRPMLADIRNIPLSIKDIINQMIKRMCRFDKCQDFVLSYCIRRYWMGRRLLERSNGAPHSRNVYTVYVVTLSDDMRSSFVKDLARRTLDTGMMMNRENVSKVVKTHTALVHNLTVSVARSPFLVDDDAIYTIFDIYMKLIMRGLYESEPLQSGASTSTEPELRHKIHNSYIRYYALRTVALLFSGGDNVTQYLWLLANRSDNPLLRNMLDIIQTNLYNPDNEFKNMIVRAENGESMV